MFGILKDIVNEAFKTAEAVDKAVTDIYKDAKESAEEMGIGPKSIRNMIKGIEGTPKEIYELMNMLSGKDKREQKPFRQRMPNPFVRC